MDYYKRAIPVLLLFFFRWAEGYACRQTTISLSLSLSLIAILMMSSSSSDPAEPAYYVDGDRSSSVGIPVSIPISQKYFANFDARNNSDLRCRQKATPTSAFCNTLPTKALIYDLETPWAVKISCPSCNSQWYWCRVCKIGLLPKGKCMTKPNQINKHGTFPHHLSRLQDTVLRPHDDQSEPNADSTIDTTHERILSTTNQTDDMDLSTSIDDESHFPTTHDDESQDMDSSTRIDFDNLFPYQNDNRGIRFFEREHKSRGMGSCAVVSNALHDGPNINIHEITALFGIMFSQLLHKIPKSQHRLLSALLDFALNPPPVISNHRQFSLPTQEGGFAGAFVDGSNSIPRNLPKIPIHQFGDFVAMKPSDCFRDAMAHGLVVPFDSTQLLSETPRGKEIINHVKMISDDDPHTFAASLIPWEDDMDPSYVKGNRHKVFVQLLTIGVPDEKIHTSQNTYPIVLGSANGSQADKDAVSKFILDDLLLLEQGIDCYHGAWKRRIAKCRGIIYSILADRPAKAGALWVLGGNSAYHSCFRTVGDLVSVYVQIPSCDYCFERRKNDLPAQSCEECHDWVLIGILYPMPPDYPSTPDGPEHLEFKTIDFNSLREACYSIFTNVVAGIWTTKKAVFAFGKTEGLQEDLVDLLYQAAKTFNNVGEARVYVDSLLPHYWSYPFVDVVEWIPGLMHQLFLGIVKATLGTFVKDFITSQSKHSSFVEFANSILLKLKKFNLTWLKVELLSKDGKFGKYVSENYLAYAKVAKWVYSMLSPLPVADVPYSDPVGKTIESMVVAELRAWLTNRRLAFDSNAKKPQLQKNCLDAVESNGGHCPPIIPPDRLNADLVEIEHLICAMTSMISRIMVPGGVINENQILDCDRHIKYFLSCLDRLLKKYVRISGESSKAKKQAKVVEWIDKYNFITLLSIPDSLRRYGSHRPLWEGDGKGEAGLPLIKICCKSLKGRWAYHTADRYLERRTMDRCTVNLLEKIEQMGLGDIRMVEVAKELMGLLPSLSETQDEFDLEGDGEELLRRGLQTTRRDFYLYKDVEAVEDSFAVGNEPISIVMLSSNRFGVALKPLKGEGSSVVEISMSSSVTQCHSGSHYFRWHLPHADEDDDEDSPTFFSVDDVVDSALLLPCLLETGASLYFLVTSDWHEMGPGGKITRPLVPGIVYNNDTV